MILTKKEPKVPKGVEMAKKDWIAEEDQTSPVTEFFDEYEITDNANHYVESSEIKEFGLKVAPGVTPMLFAKNLSKYIKEQIIINNYVNVKNKAKKLTV